MEEDFVKRRASHIEMSTDVYLPKNTTHSSPLYTPKPWFEALLDSTLSTTRYLSDTYANVVFKVVGQEERAGHIYRISEFLVGDRVVVHSVVDIPVKDNPAEFIEIMRGRVVPIGDIIRDKRYRVERNILWHDASS
jgi:hypothetical protein